MDRLEAFMSRSVRGALVGVALLGAVLVVIGYTDEWPTLLVTNISQSFSRVGMILVGVCTAVLVADFFDKRRSRP
jgi:hypothetical protein